MAKKWSSTSTSSSHHLDDEEMPSLTNSETSPASRTIDSSDYHSETTDGYRSYYSDADDSDNENDEPIVRRRHTDADAIDRSHRSATISTSPPRERPSRQIQRDHIHRAIGSRSVSRARSRSQRPRQQQQQRRHPSRSRSRPRPTTTNNVVGRQRRRFSYTRRQSLDGTTTYPTPHMATLDTHLRTTSGLRLQTDGTCNFIFEEQKFVIETTEDTGDFLFYASFGPLKEIQRKMSKPQQLLRLLAYWNEELKQRNMRSNDDTADNDVEYEGGLLRIDSSKADGPHVAFIYYGHMDDIDSAGMLQETLDDFVDDALEFSDRWRKLNGTASAGSNNIGGHGTGSGNSREHGDSTSSLDRSNRSARGAAVGRSSSPPVSDSDIGRGTRVNRDHLNTSNHADVMNRQHINQKEAATLAAQTIQDKPDNSNTATTTSNSANNQSAPSNNSSKPKSVFTKMISTLRNKTTQQDHINSMAFVDPSNPACAFVVDKEALDANEVKPTIVFSRKGGGGAVGVGDGGDMRKGSSFHDKKQTSFHDTRPNNRDTNSYPKRGRSFHHVGDDYSHSEGNVLGGSSQSSRRPHHRKATSFCVDDGSAPPPSTKTHKKSTSFHVDDYSNTGRHRHPSHRKSQSTSFHLDDSTRSSKAKSRSFHHAERGTKSSNKRSSYSDEYEKSTESIDIYDNKSGPHTHGGGARFHQSEPVGVSRRNDPSEPTPGPPHRRQPSRRHSTVTSQQQTRRPAASKRHSMPDEDMGSRARSKSRSGRRAPPPPPF